MAEPSPRHTGRNAPSNSMPSPLMVRSGALMVLPACTSVPGINHRYLPHMATMACALLPKSATDLKTMVLDIPGAQVICCGASAPVIYTIKEPALACACLKVYCVLRMVTLTVPLGYVENAAG